MTVDVSGVKTATGVSAATTQLVVTISGAAGKVIYLQKVSAGFGGATNSAAAQLFTITDGATVIANFEVGPTQSFDFDPPLPITAGADCVLTLAAGAAASPTGVITAVYRQR